MRGGGGDMNGWIGDRVVRAGITGAFGVPGENDNGRRVVGFCAERGLCAGNQSRAIRYYSPLLADSINDSGVAIAITINKKLWSSGQ